VESASASYRESPADPLALTGDLEPDELGLSFSGIHLPQYSHVSGSIAGHAERLTQQAVRELAERRCLVGLK
jgi:hypothetical protein